MPEAWHNPEITYCKSRRGLVVIMKLVLIMPGPVL